MLNIIRKVTTWTLSSFGSNRRTADQTPGQISDVTRIIMDWPENERFSAREALRRFPHLQNSRESVINLVVHEFGELRNEGTIPDVDAFVEQFPEHLRTELKDAIFVDRGMTVLSGLLAGLNYRNDSSLARLSRNLDWPESGDIFAGFLLEEPLGRGGFSRVFVAREIAFENRLVALKICRSDSHEPSVLARLQHAGIGTIHSVTEVPERGLIAICMPLLSRTTLLDVRTHVWSRMRCPSTAARVWECVQRHNRLNRTPPIWAESSYSEWVVDLAASLARSLSASHEKGIVHCDIKPSNILLGEDGRPILFDFNIAFHKLTSSNPLTVGGTLPYMSPEQILAFSGNGAHEVGPRSDLFSLGATIYEMLTGVAPFGLSQNCQFEIDHMIALRQTGPTSIQRLNPRVPDSLADVVHACLASRAEDRPSSAAEVADRLERIRKQNLTRTGFRRRTASALAGSVAAIVVALGVFVTRTAEDRSAQSTIKSASGAEAALFGSEREKLVLTDGQVSKLLDKGYSLIDQNSPAEALEQFRTVLECNRSHLGAAIGAMRAALSMPEPPVDVDVQQIASTFDPRSIPELEALCGTALGGGVFNHYQQAEYHLRKAIDAGKTDVATMNNLAFCLDSQGKYELAKAILQQLLADGDAPDTVRLLMVRNRMSRFLSEVTRLESAASLEERIAELKSEDLLVACNRSAFRSLMAAQLEHACCIGYQSLAQRVQRHVSENEDRKWRMHSRAAVSAYEDAVEQGADSYMWPLVSSALHPAIRDTRVCRQRNARFIDKGLDSRSPYYRRWFIQDPVVGTAYENWKAEFPAPGRDLIRSVGNTETSHLSSRTIARMK